MCEPGYYSKPGEVDCKPCPAGYYCVGGVEADKDPQECDNGYYSDYAQIKCTKCPVGFICKETLKTIAGVIRCPPGYYIKDPTTCEICPKGHMCPFPQFGEPEPCGPGTYAPQKGMAFCAPCPHGHSCEDPTEEAKPCPEGKYAYLYDGYCQICPEGNACTGYLKLDCPLNFYADAGASECTKCPDANTCMRGPPQVCADGEYAVTNTYLCRKCPAGYSCKAGVAIACAAGKYAPHEGVTECLDCPEGTFSVPYTNKDRTIGATTCENCPGGYECPGRGASVPCLPGQYSIPGDEKCHKGILGFVYPPYAEHPRTAHYLSPRGMYTKDIGEQVAVMNCPAGTYTAVQGSGAETDCNGCPEGFYCPEGTGNPILYMCPQGYYCEAKSKLPTPCPADTYSMTRGGRNIASCRTCPLGLY
jgi:hypothetical protein